MREKCEIFVKFVFFEICVNFLNPNYLSSLFYSLNWKKCFTAPINLIKKIVRAKESLYTCYVIIFMFFFYEDIVEYSFKGQIHI